jgi:hypothetical protein
MVFFFFGLLKKIMLEKKKMPRESV